MTPRKLRVVMYPRTAKNNPYVDIFRSALQGHGFQVEPWKHHGPLVPVPHIVVLHWAEQYWLPEKRWRDRIYKLLARWSMLLRLDFWRARGTKVVWMAHNTTPHNWEGDLGLWIRTSAPLFRRVDAVAHMTQASIADPAFARLRDRPAGVVRHPLYPVVREQLARGSSEKIARLLFIGGLDPRKQAKSAIEAALKVDDVEIIVTGRGDDTWLPRTGKVTLMRGHLPDSELQALFDGRSAVVLSQDDQLNSGLMYLALSWEAVVICPTSATNSEVSEIAGRSWVRMYEQPLSTHVLNELLNDPIPGSPPHLSDLSSSSVAKQFQALTSRILQL